ncbi:MAG: hypothetical protein B6U86_05075 [Candidatus Altiarchaeales archaeon ex4484_43]|nr:MAG: hypothetical protein B6U86_05075 [Candidatus Altiarchaeales archaeon ex4484_43]
MNVRDVMRRNVITIDPDASILDSMRKMVNERITSLIVEKPTDKSVYGIITRKDIVKIENDIGSLLVEKGSDYGIVTRKDIVNKVIARGKDPMEVKVKDIMTEPILTVSSDMSITETARLMAKTNVRRFPVVDDGKLVGIVSNSDILRSTIP